MLTRLISIKIPAAASLIAVVLLMIGTGSGFAQEQKKEEKFDAKAYYTKHEYYIPMRDGVSLFTAVYTPKDKSKTYPMLMKRTPYSLRPYGVNNFPTRFLGPNGGDSRFARDGYIFVYQDVRGRNMSEGDFKMMTPHIDDKKSVNDVDESSDTYDTVEWLLRNIKNHNGKVGIWGISYPGFYAAASIVDTHPAIKASSPQAPMGDVFMGDDFHHGGALFLIDTFRFFRGFDSGPKNPTKESSDRYEFTTNDSYKFFLELGALSNVNEKYYHGKSPFWNDIIAHPNYDEYWQSRRIMPHLKNIKTNVMTVFGTNDAEDFYTGTKIYQSIEKNNKRINNMLVLGPWVHGGWVRTPGDYLGNVPFDVKMSEYYQKEVDLKFFNYYLKGEGKMDLPEVLAFASGSNEWHELEAWPPKSAKPYTLYLNDGNSLSTDKAKNDVDEGSDSYVSDPANPVPYTNEIRITRSREYMVEDQRFAGRRPDVMVYETKVLTEDYTAAGPIIADLYVSLTGTDADFIVKVIDVFPDDFPEHEAKYMKVPMGGYQMMVRGDVIRGKFRNDFSKPEAFIPGEVSQVKYTLPDVFHTFRQGHRIMVQVQSSWFPLVDRNPQQFLNIYTAKNEDYTKATHTIHRTAEYPSSITFGRVE